MVGKEIKYFKGVVMRRNPLAVGEVYHIYNRSIAEYKIFNDDSEYSRMMGVFRYYQNEKPAMKFSDFIRSAEFKQGHHNIIPCSLGIKKHVQIIAYSIMPTHVHLILKQLTEIGISTFMSNVLNSYTRYFNTRHRRKGPLWEGRFKNIIIKTDEQLLHLTRYIHLNPVTAYLIDKPEKWPASSYGEYLGIVNNNKKFCRYSEILDIEPIAYKNFVEDRISYQRELAKIKEIILE